MRLYPLAEQPLGLGYLFASHPLRLDERQAQYFLPGGIRWKAETDKTGRYTVTPIRQDVREAIDTYLRKSPRVGDVPLFPSPKDDSKPIRRDLTARWLLNAEKLAGLPKLAGSQFPPLPQTVGDRAQASTRPGRGSRRWMEDSGNRPAALSTSGRSDHVGGCTSRTMTRGRFFLCPRRMQ